MVSLIEQLEERGHAYKSDDSVYYRISSFPEYGKLSKINFAGNIAGASERIDTDKYERKTRAISLCGRPPGQTKLRGTRV
jgi:cysteinyl-tRNA synthetase